MSAAIETYLFVLSFAFIDPCEEPEKYVDQLGEAGCHDALIGIGQKGKIAFQFNREATNAAEAILSAIQDVERVIPAAKLVGIAVIKSGSPDILGEIAKLMNE